MRRVIAAIAVSASFGVRVRHAPVQVQIAACHPALRDLVVPPHATAPHVRGPRRALPRRPHCRTGRRITATSRAPASRPHMPAAKGAPRLRASLKLDGQVYASPIVVDGRTVVATENDTVYAFDNAGRQIWRRHLGPPSPAGERPCGNIDPLGITGTPVYDKAHGARLRRARVRRPAAARTGRARAGRLDRCAGARASICPGVETAAMQERGALTDHRRTCLGALRRTGR